jgi:hypothetical protein
VAISLTVEFMLRSYARRAFLVAALSALEPAATARASCDEPVRPQPPATPAASAPDPSASSDSGPSLFDVLSRIQTPNPTVTGVGSGAGLPPSEQAAEAKVRRPLGPVPGITLAGIEATSAHKKHGGFFGSIADWFSSMESKTGTKIKATGYSTLSFSNQNVSGSDTAFQSDQYYGRGSGGIYNDTDLTVDATLFKWFHYTTRVSNSLFKNPNDNRVKLDYNTPSTRVEVGDINVNFQGNSLIDFSRYLHGVQFKETWSQKLSTTLLFSQTKATTQTIVVNGNNSSGPYYVYAGQIVDGSAQVRVDNQVLTPGTDYTLDSFTGQLNFLKNRIILQTSTIAVSFESLGYSSSQGSIYGGRAEVTAKKGWTIGTTFIEQAAQGSAGNQMRTEQFNGYGIPTFYYTSAPIDTTKPIIITVGGQPLTTGQYTIDTSTSTTNRIFLTVAVDASTIVQIQYIPYNSTVTPGNRSIIGLDTRYTMGKLGSLTLESAMSGLSLTGASVNGNAWLARADLTPAKNLHTILTLKAVSPTFSSIQSPGFTQNEKSVEFSGDYSPITKLKLNFDVQHSLRPTYSGTNQFTVSSAGNDTFNQYTVGANYTLSKNSNLAVTRNDIATNYAVGGTSTTTSNALTYSQTIKKVSLDFSLNTNTANVNSSAALLGLTTGTTSGSSAYVSNSSSYGGRLGLRWQANKALNFTGALSLNQIKNDSQGTSTGSTAKDSQISANYTGLRKVRLNYSLDLSDTGSAAITSNGTTTTTGSAGSKAILAPYLPAALPPTLSIANSIQNALNSMSRVSSTTTSSSSSAGTLYGGGINSGLGGYGNQNNVINSTTGFTSFGGRSLTNRLQADIQPNKKVQLGISLDSASSLGDYQYNSDRTGIGINTNWQMNDRMQFSGSFNMQHLVYTGSFGGTDSKTALFNFQGKPFGGKLGTQFGFQMMHTSSAFNTSATSTTTSLTNTSNDLSSLSARLDYPVNPRQTIFVEFTNSITSGYLANAEADVRFGLDYAITKTLKFSFGWQILSHMYNDAANSNLNYHASNLLAQFGVHF